MSNVYYINTVKGKRGPFTLEQLQRAVGDGKIPPTTAICIGDTEEWVTAKTVPGLFSKSKPTYYYVQTVKCTRGPYLFEQLQALAKKGLVKETDGISIGEAVPRKWVLGRSLPELFPQVPKKAKDADVEPGRAGKLPEDDETVVTLEKNLLQILLPDQNVAEIIENRVAELKARIEKTTPEYLPMIMRSAEKGEVTKLFMEVLENLYFDQTLQRWNTAGYIRTTYRFGSSVFVTEGYNTPPHTSEFIVKEEELKAIA